MKPLIDLSFVNFSLKIKNENIHVPEIIKTTGTEATLADAPPCNLNEVIINPKPLSICIRAAFYKGNLKLASCLNSLPCAM